MIYVKSFLAGIAAVVIAAFAFLFGMGAYYWIVYRPIGNEAIGWDPISLANPVTWVTVIGIFLAGFLWELRRATSK
jgi:hypothetical protein